MLQVNKDVEYGLMSLIAMGEGEGLAPARALADRLRIPAEILRKTLQRLGQAGLVESVKGARGGYRLRRPLEEIKVGEVIQAIQGPVRLAPCLEEGKGCDQQEGCNIRPVVLHLQDRLTGFLASLSLVEFRGYA